MAQAVCASLGPGGISTRWSRRYICGDEGSRTTTSASCTHNDMIYVIVDVIDSGYTRNNH
ncbi:hypothetical protein FA95DRAFT_867986 [Auriscalpium vulgare]|uniref:Uncharacterized protein n=1 Tax=Auriscalpium vulgare TaxID=40419 RepID=A0ACB8R8X7_9AGAM|nr:hypothetical protein FA95DRAFT_867986 [Auriscalpium vulgare]